MSRHYIESIEMVRTFCPQGPYNLIESSCVLRVCVCVLGVGGEGGVTRNNFSITG